MITVGKKDEPKGSINEFARIVSTYKDGSVWVANLNMPFAGTISKVYTREQFDKLFERIYVIKKD